MRYEIRRYEENEAGMESSIPVAVAFTEEMALMIIQALQGNGRYEYREQEEE
ncbi:MAG: hypothetical protein K5770_14810 [Lachnospiraceae bacterium]|nr:hypothetical protein [Lachnospiraceae bacterium]